MQSIHLIIASMAVIVWFGIATPADAGPYHGHYPSHVYISGYRSCGTPIYTERYFIRRDRCGSPVWGYRSVMAPARHFAPRVVYCEPPRARYDRPAVCPPPYSRYHHSGSRVVISGSYRR